MSDTPQHDEPDAVSTDPVHLLARAEAEHRLSFDVRTALRNLLIRHVRDELGPSGVTYAPVPGLEAFGDQPQPDPLAAVRAARELQWVAAGLLGEYIDLARGRGVPWRDLAASLSITGDADEEGIAPAEAAFHFATTGRIDGDVPHRRWGDEPYRSWRCASCREWVHDRGPFNGNPDDDETGHGPGCARHTAELAAWRTRLDSWDEEWDEDDGHQDGDEQNGDDGDGDR
jgi:hypothetical protein